jgi:phenylalanine-4-hydroxylase
LSSIGESYNCLQPNVRKLPYSIEAVNFNFDITSQQPQLFVTPDFTRLNEVLEEYVKDMALMTGGVSGLVKAVDSGTTATAVFDSGLQVSGIFTQVLSVQGEIEYFRTSGATALCYNGKVLQGHGQDYHKDGFGAPVGRLKGHQSSLTDFSETELAGQGIEVDQYVTLEFESGVKVAGLIKSFTQKEGKLLLITFDQCLVKLREVMLFNPEWGLYDMAVGEKIISVYAGPADAEAFGLSYPVPAEKTHKIHHSLKAVKLHSLYREVKSLREDGYNPATIEELWKAAFNEYPEEWLLALDIYELLLLNDNPALASEVKSHLEQLSGGNADIQKLIHDGIQLLQPDYTISLHSQ